MKYEYTMYIVVFIPSQWEYISQHNYYQMLDISLIDEVSFHW